MRGPPVSPLKWRQGVSPNLRFTDLLPLPSETQNCVARLKRSYENCTRNLCTETVSLYALVFLGGGGGLSKSSTWNIPRQVGCVAVILE